jgi:hypothetical protein
MKGACGMVYIGTRCSSFWPTVSCCCCAHGKAVKEKTPGEKKEVAERRRW